MYADPYPPTSTPKPVWQRDDGDVRGSASILGSLSLAHASLCLSPSPQTSTGNCAIHSAPIPQCPLKHLQLYSAPICHSWECGGVSSYAPTSTDGTTPTEREKFQPPPKVTLLPYYSFICSEWWIMMMLLPYFVYCGNQAHAWIAHSVAFHLCAGSLLADVLAPAVHLKADPNSVSYQCGSANCMQMSGLPSVHNLRRFVHCRVFSRRLLS